MLQKLLNRDVVETLFSR